MSCQVTGRRDAASAAGQPGAAIPALESSFGPDDRSQSEPAAIRSTDGRSLGPVPDGETAVPASDRFGRCDLLLWVHLQGHVGLQ